MAPLAALAEGLPDDIVRAELRGGWRTADGTHMAALHLTLAPGWKTYWRAPGDAGIPPSFDWTGSTNVGAVTFHWPSPDVFDLSGMRTLGYHDELVLPIEIAPASPGGPVELAARIDLGVCEDVCVPVTLSVRAVLPEGTEPDPVIRAALSEQPERAGGAPARCAVEPIRDGLRLTAEIGLPKTGPDEFAVVELADASVWVSPAQTRREGGRLVSVADLVPANAQPFALDRSDIRITLFGGGRAVQIDGCTG